MSPTTHPATIDQATAEALVTRYVHPTAVRILRELADGSTASPKQLAERLADKLGNVSYHVRILAKDGFLELVDTQPRRGAVEHFYRKTRPGKRRG